MMPTNDPSQMLRNAGLAVGFVVFAVLGAFWLLALAQDQPIFQRPSVKTSKVAPDAALVARTDAVAPYTDYKSDAAANSTASSAAPPQPLPATASPVAQSIREKLLSLPPTPRTPGAPIGPVVPPARPIPIPSPPKNYEYVAPPPRQTLDVRPTPGPGPGMAM